MALQRIRSAAPFSGRSDPAPDQLPANWAKGPTCANAAKAKARKQHPRMLANKSRNGWPNVRRKSLSPFKLVLRTEKIPRLDGKRGSSRSPLGCVLSPGPSTAFRHSFTAVFSRAARTPGAAALCPLALVPLSLAWHARRSLRILLRVGNCRSLRTPFADVSQLTVQLPLPASPPWRSAIAQHDTNAPHLRRL